DNLKISTSLKSMYSAVKPSVLSSISTSNSFPLETEQNFNEEEKYMPLLTSHQHFVRSDIEKDEEEDTRNIHKDTIVVNTNLYILIKDAGAVDKKWQNIDRKELIIWIALVIY
ncbi:14912_t:CDS:2, partial [Funneliformis mosseae]